MRFDWSISVIGCLQVERINRFMKEIKLYIHASYIIFNFVKWEMNMIGCLQVVRIYSFMKEIKLFIHASYIIFHFATSKYNNFVKEIELVLRASIAWWKLVRLRLAEN